MQYFKLFHSFSIMSGFVIIATAVSLAIVSAEVHIVDMSHELVENVTYFWSRAAMLKRYPNPINGQHEHFWVADFNLYMGEHGGTHLDSPGHFCKDCRTMEQIPLSDLLSLPLCVVDVSNKTKDDPDYGLTVADFEEWEAEHGRIPDGSAVFTNVGWQQYYPERKTFLGSDIEDPTLYHFPGLTPEAVVWLAEERKIKGVGTDAPSFDRAQNFIYEAHTELLTRNLWGAEVVANMDKVPASGARVNVLPTKFRGGTGAASRIYAVWNTDSGANCPRSSVGVAFFLIVALMVYYG